MKKALIILEEIFLSFVIAASLGTWLYADSFVCGNDITYSLQSLGPAMILLAPSYLFVLLLQFLLKKTFQWADLPAERDATLARLRPLYICSVAFFNPSFSYFFIGLQLFILSLLFISFRLFTTLRSTEKGKEAWEQLENQVVSRPGRTALMVSISAFVIYLLIISGLFSALPQPEGDEPHYITTAYSILHDGDLQLANNYQQQHFRLWHTTWIQAHTKAGKNGMSEQYSMHNIGLSLYLVPFLQTGLWLGSPAGIHFMIRLGMIILASLYIWVLFKLLLKLTGKGIISLGITLLVAFTSPVLFFSYHCFTEIAAALLLTTSFYILWRNESPAPKMRVLLGLMLGSLPWLGVKYFLLAATFVALWLVKEIEWKLDLKKALLVALPGMILGAFFFWQTYDLFGTISPSAYYLGAEASVTDQNIVFKTAGADLSESMAIVSQTILSYFLDQREGLLFYSPWYLLGIAGLLYMLFSGKVELRKLAFWLLILAIPFVILYGLTGFGGGHSPPSRSLMPVLFLFITPAAIMLKNGLGLLREVFSFLVLVSLALALILILNPASLYHDFHVAESGILSWFSSPLADFAKVFPSINNKHFENWNVTWIWSIFWIVLAIGFSISAGRQPKRFSIAAGSSTLFLVLLLFILSFSIKLPPTIKERFVSARVPASISFPVENSFIDQEGFWVKTGRKQSCFLVSKEDFNILDLHLRSVVPNDVILSNGLDSRELKFVKSLRTRIEARAMGGFRVGDFFVKHFTVTSVSGNPAGLKMNNGDSRPLGVEVRLLNAR